MLKQKSLDYILTLLLGVTFAFIAYGIKRHETTPLLITYCTAFGIYLWIISRSSENDLDFWFYTSIIFRGLLLFSIPNLSDDFYRYIWDGRLLAAGIHPFAEVPSYYIHHGVAIPGIDRQLYEHLNSPDYFTIYPPVAQFIFLLAAKISPQSVYGALLVMKGLVFLAEIGSLVLLRKIITLQNLSAKNILFYALNPLVILELSGNIHLEAFLILFLLFSMYYILIKKLFPSAVSFSLAFCTKLIPLIFLPILFLVLGWKKAFRFYVVTTIVSALLFLPLLNPEIIDGFGNSLGYYFKKFEFNASMYYLVREVGYWLAGFNIIQTAGWALGLMAAISIVWITFSGHRPTVDGMALSFSEFQLVADRFLLILFTYFLFSTVVHPWYITTLVALTVFTRYRFVVIWSALAFLTYAGYTVDGYQENLQIISLEYILVFAYLVYELLWKKEHSSSLA